VSPEPEEVHRTLVYNLAHIDSNTRHISDLLCNVNANKGDNAKKIERVIFK